MIYIKASTENNIVSRLTPSSYNIEVIPGLKICGLRLNIHLKYSRFVDDWIHIDKNVFQ